MKNFLLAGAAALAIVSAPAAAQQADPSVSSNPLTDRATLENDVRTLAADDMEGREAGTDGYERAAQYVAGRYADIGLLPAGDDGSYFQSFNLVRHSAAAETRMGLVNADGSRTKASYGDDFVGGGFASAGDENGVGTVEAELVFVGHGLQIPSLGLNDLEGVDLDGKIVVWVFDLHEDLDSLLSTHLLGAGAERFADTGAVGAIMVWPEAQRIPYERARAFFGNVGGLTWAGPDGVAYDGGGDLEFSLVASPALSRELLAGTEFDMDALNAAITTPGSDMPSFAIDRTVRVAYANAYEEELTTSNVLGILPGTDPSVADEYVVITAHLDHEGLQDGHGPDNDQLFNGAMDNATGVSAMLEMGRLLGEEPTRRPIIFAALGAEELGLLGSSYHANNQDLENGSIVANVNVDMPILTYPFTDVVAFGADRSNLGAAVDAAVETYGLTLVPDPNPDENFFFRSDQYSYVRAGIPAVYVEIGFGNGGEEAQTAFLSEHYHQPSDEADRIEYEQLGRFADIAYLVATDVGNMTELPAWNPSDFFGDVFGGPVQDSE